MDKKHVIYSALERLLQRPNRDAFLIIEENTTTKFVQFSKDNADNLIFDLPDQTLTSEEITRALQVLKRYELSHAEWEVFDQPGGKVVGIQKGFTRNVGKDIDVITEIAYTVFTEIYLFVEPIHLSMTEH